MMRSLIRHLALLGGLLAQLSYGALWPLGWLMSSNGPSGGNSITRSKGVCGKTAADHYTGWIDVGRKMHMWFWLVEADEDAENKPLVIWLNGGPGHSSMHGLFLQNGPCLLRATDKKKQHVTREDNEFSWNQEANMLYIDQPSDVGFSWGEDLKEIESIDSTARAAPYIWEFLQNFYKKEEFEKYEGRKVGFFGTSFAGSFVPAIVSHILARESGGTKINVQWVGLSSPWIDPAIHFPAMVDYSYRNAFSNKGAETEERYERSKAWMAKRCLPKIRECEKTGSNEDCGAVAPFCWTSLGNVRPKNLHDVREDEGHDSVFETDTLLNERSVRKTIGAEQKKGRFQSENDYLFSRFDSTGDRSRSRLAELINVAKQGVAVLIMSGTADWVCNYISARRIFERVVEGATGRIGFKLVEKGLKPYTSGQGMTKHGPYSVQGEISYLEIDGGSHNTIREFPEASLQAFKQMLRDRRIKAE